MQELASAAFRSRRRLPMLQRASNMPSRREHKSRLHQWRQLVLMPRSAISAIVPMRSSPCVATMLSDELSTTRLALTAA